MSKRVESREEKGRRFAAVHGLFWRSPLLSMDAKALLHYVIARQSPGTRNRAAKPCCWATMAEMQAHFRRYDPKRREWAGSSRSRVVNAIAEVEHVLPEVLRVERKGGSAPNRYFATPYVEWPDCVVERLQSAYDALMRDLKGEPEQTGADAYGPLEALLSPWTGSGPRTVALPLPDQWTTILENTPEDGEGYGDASLGDGSRAVGESGRAACPGGEPAHE